MTLAQRQQIRNKISAQMSRLKKKEETIFLNKVVREKDDRYLKMAKSLCKVIDVAQGHQLMDFLKKEWDLKSAKPAMKKTTSKVLSKKLSVVQNDDNLYDFLKEHFVTKQDILDQYQQNEEKTYQEE